jgi:hypothetical protein
MASNAERRHAQQHQQRSDLRGRLSSTRKVELPPLRVTLVTMRQALDERRCEVEPIHCRAAAAAVATSRGYVANARKRKYALPASCISIKRKVHCNAERPPPKT